MKNRVKKVSLTAKGIIAISIVLALTACQNSDVGQSAEEAIVETVAAEDDNDILSVSEGAEEPEAEPVYVSVESPEWAEAYIEYLKGEVSDYYSHSYYTPYCMFSLIYIDDDDIPELVRIGQSEADGCRIISYTDDGLEETQLFRLDFGYYEKENLLDNCSMHMGGIYENFYSIIDGKMTLIGEGVGEQSDPSAGYDFEYGDDGYPLGYDFTWNGVPVSRDEYVSNVRNIYAGHNEENYKSYYEDEYPPDTMINIISYMESGVSLESLDDLVVSEPASDDLTEGQKVVILQVLPELLSSYYRVPELRTEDLTQKEIVDYIYIWMFLGLNEPSVLIPADHDPVLAGETEYGGQYYYMDWYEKDSVLKKLGDFLGRTVTDEDIGLYGDVYEGMPVFMIDGDVIGIMSYAGGEDLGWMVPRIKAYTIEDGKLTLSVPFEIEGDGYEGDTDSHATVVFRVNPDSFFGYSLESVKFDGNYFDVPAGMLGTVESGVELSEVQSHITGIMASSVLTDNGTEYPPTYVLDGDLTTAWAEGVAYDGIGQNITIMLDDTYTVSGITIYNGYQKSSDLYNKNSRPRQISVTTSEGQMYPDFELEDKMGAQTITFDEPVETDFVQVTIWAVYPGSTYQDTLISEIQLN